MAAWPCKSATQCDTGLKDSDEGDVTDILNSCKINEPALPPRYEPVLMIDVRYPCASTMLTIDVMLSPAYSLGRATASSTHR